LSAPTADLSKRQQRPAPIALKAALFALLAANTFYFLLSGTPSSAVDSIAWLTLLVLFEAEASFGRHLNTPRRRLALRAVRLAAAAGVFAGTLGYVFEDDVLDAVNSALWIGVVILLEVELRWQRPVAKAPYVFGGVAVILYGGLAVLIVLWALEGLWFDAYDAVLWLVAFVTLELNIMRKAEAENY
jgi:hypothetical protein